MPKYTAIPIQTVVAGQNVLLTDTLKCNRGYVLHSNGSGVITLRGITSQCFARYKVTFGGNVAIPTGGTVAPITVALTVNGESLGSATAISTPAAVDEYGNIFMADLIDVPRGCCLTVTVRNTGTTPINIQNGNLIIERVA